MNLCIKCKQRPAVVFIAATDGQQQVGEPQGYCLVCAREFGLKPFDDLLKQMNIGDEDLEAMSNQMGEFMDQIKESGEMIPLEEPPTEDGAPSGENSGSPFSPGGAMSMPFFRNMFGMKQDGQPEQNEAPAARTDGKTKERHKKRKYLDGYCINLTAKAKNGELDNIIGRENEMYRVLQILSRRQKNNPCLIGEPGVGKTAIAEGLAIKIANKDVPARLADKEIHLLDLTALVAGTQFRGQFESRVKGLVDEVKAEGNIILFIDELHNLVGTGDAEGSMNAANILKPALSRGQIQVIGATTFREYRKYIEKDAALERRFQPVVVEEPSLSDTIALLGGVKHYYESYHNVRVSDSIVERAVKLSERYINDRFLPDKAIDLLDEACSCACLRNRDIDDLYENRKELNRLMTLEGELEADIENPDYEQLANVRSQIAVCNQKIESLADLDNEVTSEDLAHVIELWTGIPATKINTSDLRRLSALEDELKKHIIGQDDAVGLVAAAVRRSRVQISPKRRPASFIFVGPTGVGKTELVKVLATELFDTPETLIRLDMSEFMEKHSVSRIIGAPPGYVGYDEAGQLTEKVRRKPYSVLLLDEIEKAHPDVLNILLQILDDGHITDASGRNVNFENTIIIMTSNAGSDQKGASLGFAKSTAEQSHEKVMKALEEFLRPEFIGRVDEIVVFRPLMQNDFEAIAHLILDELKPTLKECGLAMKYSDSVCANLAERAAESNKRGARELRTIIRREVEDKIAALLVEGCDNVYSGVSISLKEGKICVGLK